MDLNIHGSQLHALQGGRSHRQPHFKLGQGVHEQDLHARDHPESSAQPVEWAAEV